ncbi:nuclear transport factor 2 family protein [Polymorphum gilvum]|uniref:Taurine dehydrogenase small subunit n=1 Tax=Polymorphum gilvum (strain LMG 25793 / CGMCC 1.9160 / SL003B-26A1) TaxID=991905 RepID=F2IVQ8_POLGS|nr:nuclear transport factor 2 family protein [Polymorphum gilvum]ADZ69165.1 Taurine dehydrogenase small subunit [Polymorphum gilvum SL003B-26A1]
MAAQAESVTHIDDDRFKVTEWRFAPGAETGWHVHGHDYVIVPLTDGTLELSHPDGSTSTAPLLQGVPYSRRTGVSHNVVNGGDGYLAFLEIEVVDDAPVRRRLATLERFADAWNAGDVDALMACMADGCEFLSALGPTPEGTRHVGRDAVRAAYEAIFAAYSSAAWTEVRHSISGDIGLSTWRFVGTDREGRDVDVHGCDVLTFAGDLIAVKDSYRKARP